MNVLLVSECSGKALPRSRRILDQFAERVGSRTWQTTITAEGLATLRKLLRSQARKNTAVACHWIRGKSRTEVIWIVGNARRFGPGGTVPTNWTERPIMAGHGEDEWNGLLDIQLMSGIAGLFHDFGKANRLFQRKLRDGQRASEPYRHEWVSLCLFVAFVKLDNPGNDDQVWLDRLIHCNAIEGEQLTKRVVDLGRHLLDSAPLKEKLSSLAKAIGWLIVTHHGLPSPNQSLKNSKQRKFVLKLIKAPWNRLPIEFTEQQERDCWTFDDELPFSSRTWCRRAQWFAKSMSKRPPCAAFPDAFQMHLSRLALVVGDHSYSNGPARAKWSDRSRTLYANTDYYGGPLKQKLDDHLIGVGLTAARIARGLVRVGEDLPRLARHPGFRKRSKNPKYRWQDKAFDLSCSIRDQTQQHGFFGVNMASTGTGKTFANARIMYGLADPNAGARFTIAIGLRVLTLQTGQAFRDLLGLDSDVLAVRAGDAAARALFDLSQSKLADERPKPGGSESAAIFTDTSSYVHYDGVLEDGPLSQWLKRDRAALQLVSAPILACTVDHLTRATEATRGGKHIPAMLRLLSADVVLDEPDDFGMSDMPALARMMNWAGMLGARVLLSSATLPPSMLRGMFDAYLAGRAIFQANVGIPGLNVKVPCAWFDEFGCRIEDHASGDGFSDSNHRFVAKRVERLRQSPCKRKVEVVLPTADSGKRSEIARSVARQLPQWIDRLHHDHHSVCQATGKRVSFGLIRMANIQSLIGVAKELFAYDPGDDTRYWLCPYHSQHPLVVRAAIERTLDSVLDRRLDSADSLAHPEVISRIQQSSAIDHVFLILATSVAEVGRDHDYDWAIVEPSSMRSIIQLAGRVVRHRDHLPSVPNMLLLDTNIRSIWKPEGATYIRPGFEESDAPYRLKSKSISDILQPEQLEPLDAVPRLLEREELDTAGNLADLEHGRLRRLFLGTEPQKDIPITQWWDTRAHLTGELQSRQRFRASAMKSIRYLLVPDEELNDFDFMRVEKDQEPTAQNNRFSREPLEHHARTQPFAVPDYLDELANLVESLNHDVHTTISKFGYLDVQEGDDHQEWIYNATLGVWRPED